MSQRLIPFKNENDVNDNKDNESEIKLWVGTWNIGFTDPFTKPRSQSVRSISTLQNLRESVFGVSSSCLIPMNESNTMLRPLIPHGYNMYVMGIQEGITENIYKSIESYLNFDQSGNEDDVDEDDDYNDDKEFIRLEVPKEGCFVFGYGDGALKNKKFTGIAVFVQKLISSRVTHILSAKHQFAALKGSKGGAAIKMCIDDSTTLVFVNCHLEANDEDIRREQINELEQVLGYKFSKKEGIKTSNKRLSDSYHYIIWMGDMNYRIKSLEPNNVLKMLKDGKSKELHDKYDTLLEEMKNGRVFENFKEATKAPQFYPTYKKIKDRGLVDIPGNKRWPTLTYVTEYEVSCLKRLFRMSTKTHSSKCPGWTDRILFHFNKDSASNITLKPERVPYDNEDKSICGDNYCAVNNGPCMDVSDHSPVFCTFVLSSRIE